MKQFAISLLISALLLQQTRAQSIDARLLDAAGTGDLESVKTLLAQGASVDARDDRGWTPLILAAKAGRLEVMKALMEKGADVNATATTEFGNTVLSFATEPDDPAPLQLLLNHGAQLEGRSKFRFGTALHTAVSHHRMQAAAFLISKGADVNRFAFRSSKGVLITPLLSAVIEKDCAMAELLLEKGADIEKRNNLGTTVLIEAAKFGEPPMVKFLIGKGAKVNAIGPNGHTAFMLAASQGRTENMKLLLAAGADPDAIARDEDGLQYDATFLVKQSGNPEAVALVEEAQKNSKQAALKP